MPDRLPPLTALRAFEAAARHMSFARAADELSVTPAALSFQIKALEADLGQPVFRRLNRAVELTDAGRALVPGTREGFAAIRAAWAAARRLGDSHRLNVTAGPGFTAKWLAPRLFGFARRHPEIELRFSATLRLMEFGVDDIDVAIRFGRSSDAGLFSRVLIPEWVAPMAVPEIAARLASPADLAGEALLHQDDIAFLRPSVDWSAWFAAVGLGSAPRGGALFSQADHAIDAALAGAGVVLGRFSMAHDALKAGTLVMPFPLALSCRASYRFLCAEGAETRPQVAAFLDWLGGEVAAMDGINRLATILETAP
jgi:LysR family glycine cleavage system transcriptional activator